WCLYWWAQDREQRYHPLLYLPACRELRFFFFSSRRRHTRFSRDWSSDVCSSDLVERGAPGGAADQEALGAAVAGGPGQIADALEAEHRVEDVERQHGLGVGAVGGGRSDPAGHGAGFVDALVEDLVLLGLAIEHHLVLVDRRVQLADRGVDAELAEHALHAEGPCFVRYYGHYALTEILVLEQLCKDAHERHGGGDFMLAGAVEHGVARL